VSFTFQIYRPAPLPRALFEDLGLPALAWVTLPEADLLSPGIYHLHIEGRSTRGVEITWEAGVLAVRILIGSSPEDFALARAIVGSAARSTGAQIQPEEGPPIGANQLDTRYGARWAMEMVEWSARMLRKVVLENGTAVLTGPVRPFNMGYRLLRALDDAGPAETFAERFLDAVRRVQYPPTRYHTPEATLVWLPGGRQVTAVRWELDQAYLFPPVTYIHLHAADGRPLFLLPEALLDLPGVHAAWADENRLLVEPVPMKAWEMLWAHALQQSVRPTGERSD